VKRVAVTGAILAGGRSRRMGSDKGLLPFGGRQLIEVVLTAIRPLFSDIVIVANEPAVYARFGVPVVTDRIPGGPLGGIHAALWSSRSPHIFCIACDMPFPNPAVITHLVALAPGYDAVVPHSSAGYEPIHAVYGRSCLAPVEALLRAQRLRLDELFASVRVRLVDAAELRPLDPSGRAFLNVNTPDDLEAARRLLEEETCAS
jgi:molybdopterin-guanine dinucleotide biosynthesis protein A